MLIGWKYLQKCLWCWMFKILIGWKYLPTFCDAEWLTCWLTENMLQKCLWCWLLANMLQQCLKCWLWHLLHFHHLQHLQYLWHLQHCEWPDWLTDWPDWLTWLTDLTVWTGLTITVQKEFKKSFKMFKNCSNTVQKQFNWLTEKKSCICLGYIFLSILKLIPATIIVSLFV